MPLLFPLSVSHPNNTGAGTSAGLSPEDGPDRQRVLIIRKREKRRIINVDGLMQRPPGWSIPSPALFVHGLL